MNFTSRSSSVIDSGRSSALSKSNSTLSACGCPRALVVGVAHTVVVAICALFGRWRRRWRRRGLLRDRLGQWLLRAKAIANRDAIDPRVDCGLAEWNCREAETGRNPALD